MERELSEANAKADRLTVEAATLQAKLLRAETDHETWRNAVIVANHNCDMWQKELSAAQAALKQSQARCAEMRPMLFQIAQKLNAVIGLNPQELDFLESIGATIEREQNEFPNPQPA